MTKNSTKKIPRLRFKGFEGEWEEKKLGEISNKINSKNKDISITDVMTDSAEFGVISQRDFFDKNIANSRNINGYYIVSPDDYIYNPRISKFASYGPIRRNNLNIKGIVSPLYYVFHVNNINKFFLDNYFLSSKWYKFIYQNGNSGARSDRISITDSSFQEMPLILPIINEEQQKIGSFFSKLDQLIDLQTQKLEQLKKLKRGYLQKMFPQNGETIPQLRFNGFSGEWKEERLGDVGKIKSGYGFPEKYQGNKIGYPFFKVSDMSNSKTEMKESNNYVNNHIISANNWKTNTPINGSILFAKVGAALNKDRKRLVYKEFLMDNNMMSYSMDLSWNSYFGLEYFLTLYLPKFAQTGALPSFNASDINSIIVLRPDLKEQKEAGLIFSKLDKIINFQYNKLNKLKILKESYLQKLFI